ncbi:MAG: hypothetical protein ACOYJS_02850 [Acutalibacteraceae bacterium]|jgi:hypothetical protein
MKQSNKITLSGLMAALACVFMLLSYFPYLTYGIPALAGLFIMVTVIEIDCKWAAGAYLTSAVLVFLFAEPESKLMYITLLGYYPIVKALIERIDKPLIEWVIKISIFNAAVFLVYFVLAGLFSISLDDLGKRGKYGTALLLALGNGAFVLYDIALSRISAVYMAMLHKTLRKFFKN